MKDVAFDNSLISVEMLLGLSSCVSFASPGNEAQAVFQLQGRQAAASSLL